MVYETLFLFTSCQCLSLRNFGNLWFTCESLERQVKQHAHIHTHYSSYSVGEPDFSPYRHRVDATLPLDHHRATVLSRRASQKTQVLAKREEKKRTTPSSPQSFFSRQNELSASCSITSDFPIAVPRTNRPSSFPTTAR